MATKSKMRLLSHFSLSHYVEEKTPLTQKTSVYTKIGKEAEESKLPIVEKPHEHFCTGTSYVGRWSELGFTGYGTYTFQTGTLYEGNFFDGMFHGEGTLTYPKGHKMDGIWDNGKLIKLAFRFKDGRATPCKFPDRRFLYSVSLGLNPPGNEHISCRWPHVEIPKKCYDIGDGFFNPNTKCVTYDMEIPEQEKPREEEEEVEEEEEEEEYEDEELSFKPAGREKSLKSKSDSEASSLEGCELESNIVIDFEAHKRTNHVVIVTQDEEKWITEHCMRAWDEPTGYRPEFYEYWTTGKRQELKDLGIDDIEDEIIDTSKFDNLEFSNDLNNSAESVASKNTGVKLNT